MREGEVTFEALVALIGSKAAIMLSKARGGRPMYVPHKPGANSPLVIAVGQDAAEALASIYGGDVLKVPNGPGKHARVRELRKSGLTIPQIVEETGYTDRNIYYVLAKEPPAEVEPPPLLALMRKT